ncbi:MAG: hypothetical protein FGM22_07310 [Burkholderiaceae bacterium]|nr:hypothetical protein [Burkholderiaceae bacterium]
MEYVSNLSDDAAEVRKAVEAASAALATVMREKMKPSDVDYAQALVRTSGQRALVATEIAWLAKFARWYDQYNNSFWTWWENGGREETEALQKARRVSQPKTGTQARPTANGTPQAPQVQAPVAGAAGAPPTPPPAGEGNGKKTVMLVGIWALVAVAGYGIYRTFKNGK